jgi:very-short-patch-repair endonuclease
MSVSDQQFSESQQIWLREAARDQRQQATLTERQLWEAIRGRRLNGLRFRRQHPIGPYIVDCLCFEARLVIEIDGPIHAQQSENDAERDEHLNQLGYRVLRLATDLVEQDLPGVLRSIETACQAPPRPHAGDDVGEADIRAAQQVGG